MRTACCLWLVLWVVLKVLTLQVKIQDKTFMLEYDLKVRLALFDSLVFNCKEEKYSFVRLLSSTTVPLGWEFVNNYTNERFIRIFKDFFFDDPSWHDILFPMRIITKNTFYWRKISPFLFEYKPKIIYLDDDFVEDMTKPEMEKLQSPLRGHPERLASFQLVRLLDPLKYSNAWELYEWRHIYGDDTAKGQAEDDPKEFKDLSLNSELAYLGMVLSMCSNSIGDHAFLISSCGKMLPESELRHDLMLFLFDPNRESPYENILAFVRSVVKDDDCRLCIWNARLLLATINVSVALESVKTERDFVGRKFVNFLMGCEISKIPIIYMQRIIQSIQPFHVKLDQNLLPLLTKLEWIDDKYPEGFGFWGDFNHYLKRWRYNMIILEPTSITLTSIKDFPQLLSEWGKSKMFLSISLQIPVIPINFLTISHPDGKVECFTITCYLATITDWLFRKSGAFEFTSLGYDISQNFLMAKSTNEGNNTTTSNSKRIWRAAARILVLNLAHCGSFGIKIKDSFLKLLYLNYSSFVTFPPAVVLGKIMRAMHVIPHFSLDCLLLAASSTSHKVFNPNSPPTGGQGECALTSEPNQGRKQMAN